MLITIYKLNNVKNALFYIVLNVKMHLIVLNVILIHDIPI